MSKSVEEQLNELVDAAQASLVVLARGMVSAHVDRATRKNIIRALVKSSFVGDENYRRVVAEDGEE